MNSQYWPWWLGGAALALVALAFPLLSGGPLGVSGALARLVSRPRRGSSPNGAPTDCAGEAAPEIAPRDSGRCGSEIVSRVAGGGSVPTQPRRNRANTDVPFLLAVVIGGALAAWVEGRPWGQTSLSPEFHRLFGTGPGSWAVLVFGGMLVGFGTRWSGGCTSGHGLSGVGRLQPASLVATAVFFGVAIAVSFALEAWRA